MKFTTTRFGEIECDEDVVMHFHDGLLGFPGACRYILLEHDADGSPFRWLQSLDDPELAFIVIDPLLVEPRYQYEIDRDTATLIGTDDPGRCAALAIIRVPRQAPVQMSVNLKAPLVINAENRRGRQLVLGSSVYAINTPLFPEVFEPVYEPQRAVS